MQANVIRAFQYLNAVAINVKEEEEAKAVCYSLLIDIIQVTCSPLRNN